MPGKKKKKKKTPRTDRHRPARFAAAGWRIGLGTSLTIAGLIALVTFGVIFPLVEKIPKWDQWSMVEVFEAHYAGKPALPLLLKPYNGHLNVLPRVFFFGLGLLTHWNVRAEVVASFVVAFGTAILLLLMLRDTDPSMLVLAAPVVAYVFSLAQFENFMSGYPFGQNLSQAASTAAVFLLTRPALRAAHISLALVAALVAAFSWGPGLAALGVGIALLVARSWPRWRWPVAWTAGTGTAVFLVGRSVHRAIVWPVVPEFLLRLLAPVFSPTIFLTVEEARFWSWLTVSIVALALAIGWRLIPHLDFLRWAGLAATALGAAFLIALGRADATPVQALASHYATATYPLAVAALALVARSLVLPRGDRLRPARALLLAALLLLPLAQLAKVALRTLPELRAWHGVNADTSAKLRAGTITDDEIHRTLHPDAALVRWGTTVLRAHRLAGFEP